MGYRSDVKAVFYTYDPSEYPSIKLFIDENVPEVFRSDEYMYTFESNNGNNLRGVKLVMSEWKWYPSYSDVQGFEQAMAKFEKLADENNRWNCEFIRVGEEVEDIEQKRSYNSDNLLYVSVSIESDV